MKVFLKHVLIIWELFYQNKKPQYFVKISIGFHVFKEVNSAPDCVMTMKSKVHELDALKNKKMNINLMRFIVVYS